MSDPNQLENFLNELLIKIKNNTLSTTMSLALGELFIKYDMENKQINQVPIEYNNDTEILKYYILGWYFYNQMN